LRKHLIITDAHLISGKEEDAAYTLVKKIATTDKFDSVVNLGDMLDLEGCSKWTAEKPLLIEGQRLSIDLECLEKELAFWKRTCKRSVYLIGNHEQRLYDNIIMKYPYLQGAIPTFEDVCENTGTEYYPLSDPIKLFPSIPLMFTHGLKAGVGAARQTLQAVGGSLVFGHCHKSSLSSWRYPDQNTALCYSLGTLGECQPSYARGKNWLGNSQSFGVLYIEGDAYQLDIIQIENNRCIIAGKSYSL
jgi:hypothetical protein